MLSSPRRDLAEPQAAAPPGSRPATAAALAIEVVTGAARLAEIRPAWRELEQSSPGPGFFQSQAWCRHVMTILEAEQAEPVRPVVLCAWRGDLLVALWPLRIESVGGARILTDLGDPFGQISDALCDPLRAGPEVLEDMLSTALRLHRLDGLHLRYVREDAAIAPLLASQAVLLPNPAAAPFVRLSAFPDFDAYHRSINSKTRKNLRNARNRLRQLGCVEHIVVRDAVAARDTLEQSFALRSDWLDSRGLASRAFNHPQFHPLVTALAEHGHGLDLVAMALKAAGETVALQWGFLHGGRYYAYMAARDPRFDEVSPGRLHLEDVMRTCAGLGVGTAELLVPDAPYKMSWASGSVRVGSWIAPFTLQGSVVLDLWQRRLRPAFRSWLLSLPAPLRGSLVRLAKPRTPVEPSPGRLLGPRPIG